MTIGEVTQLLTALAAVGSCLISLRNSAKLTEVHRTTNSLAQRNEEIAKQLGVAEGMAQQKADPT